MAKFVIECPHCGTLNQASTFIFAKKVIKCGDCGTEIDVKANRLTSRKCPHCKNVFIYDQAKKKHTCPACHKEIGEGYGKIVSFPCPECSCIIQIDENTKSTTCPVCDHFVDNVEKEVAKSKLVSDTGISVIKYEGDKDTFVWKHPIEDFNLGSQLIVHESQEAIFFLNGQALDTFGPGRWSLETENLPVLKKIQDLPTGKQNPFHAEVYFVNKTVQMSIPWGTSEKIRFIEPNTGAPIDIGAFGEMNLQVSDARKLLVKLVGTTNGIAWSDRKNFTKSLESSFKPLIQTAVKANLASIIKNESVDILEIDERLETLSNALRTKVSVGFEEYGLLIPQFYITSITLPDDNDPNFKIIKKLRTENLHIRDEEYEASMVAARRKRVLEQQETALEQEKFEAEKKRIAAQAKADALTLEGTAVNELRRQKGLVEAEVMQAKGYTEKDVLQADVQKAYAEGIGKMGSNAGGGSGGSGGSMMSDILGLGVGMAAMGAMGEKVGDVMKGFNSGMTSDNSQPNQQSTSTGWKCSCGCSGNTGKFCSECGKAKPVSWDCPSCGAKDNKGKFCSECGAAKPELWDCPHCGTKGNKGKFCSECGKTRIDASAWDCSCGNKNISGKFCPECGKRKEDN